MSTMKRVMQEIRGQGSIFDVLEVQDMIARNAARAASTSNRLLILQCGATKAQDAGLMPARDRYTGPLWQSLKKAEPVVNGSTFVCALSAKYGLVDGRDGIENYDAVLNDRSAEEMIQAGPTASYPQAPASKAKTAAGRERAMERRSAMGGSSANRVMGRIFEERGYRPLEEVCITGGKRYVAVALAWLEHWKALGFVAKDARVVVINDEIGRMRARMAAWVRGEG